MHVDAYMSLCAALRAQGQQHSDPFFPNDPETARPFLRFVWRAVCAHAWLQNAMLHGMWTGDPRSEAARWMRSSVVFEPPGLGCAAVRRRPKASACGPPHSSPAPRAASPSIMPARCRGKITPRKTALFPAAAGCAS